MGLANFSGWALVIIVDLKAAIVAVVFALVLGVAGGVIRRIVSFFYMDIGEPVWVRALWVLVPAGLAGGWVLGWWLVTS